MFRRAVYALACVLALALPVAAQEQTGQIQGSVKDSSGAVLPGVTVEVTNTSTGAVAADRGHRRQRHLPCARLAPREVRSARQAAGLHPGQNREHRAAPWPDPDHRPCAGCRRRHRDRVGHGRIANHRHQAERAQHQHLGRNVREAAEGPRLQHVVTQAPGANQETRSGGISIDGSSAAENRWIIDGAETTNVNQGTSAKNLVTDFVEEVQVKSSGYAAEYGGSTGGVINVVTRSGSNRFRGDVPDLLLGRRARLGLSARTCASSRANSREAEFVTYPEDEYTLFEPGISIGGPDRQGQAVVLRQLPVVAAEHRPHGDLPLE
jgi:hypothetical protein